ncbi:hypothetical protein [uncultured Desulfobacter sp.]|uniref:hypothetical protein n=1 Tax=uncultured Desulfobacter sp. TaxID=240139 RepID=UPI002AAB83AC|nr:hypothetical protein [uncultured Desulfobacter sp.]
MQLINNRQADDFFERLAAYIKEKNAVFIVANAAVVNRAYKDLSPDTFSSIMHSLCDCDTFLVNPSEHTLSSPFLAANTTLATRTAELAFLLDLVPQAENGKASPFYSKVMGAVATHFFAGTDQVTRLWVPFGLEDTVGRGVNVKPAALGCFIYRG